MNLASFEKALESDMVTDFVGALGNYSHIFVLHIVLFPTGFAQAWTPAPYSRHSQRLTADHLTGWVEFPPNFRTGAKGSPRQMLAAAAQWQRDFCKFCPAKIRRTSCANHQAQCKSAHTNLLFNCVEFIYLGFLLTFLL